MHTPGPWDAHPDDFGSVYGRTHYVIIDDGVQTIAYVIAFNAGRELPYKANAHLMAAAPDLLEALEELMKFHKGEDDYNFASLSQMDRANASEDAWMHIKDQIKQAIAKAKGEDQ